MTLFSSFSSSLILSASFMSCPQNTCQSNCSCKCVNEDELTHSLNAAGSVVVPSSLNGGGSSSSSSSTAMGVPPRADAISVPAMGSSVDMLGWIWTG